jgi:gamma-glutamylcyclotransferase (GGCT)/AIG2-like uncharacterized protein YtfP
MSRKRMIERDVHFTKIISGTLVDHLFTINKKSKANPNIGFANIEPSNFNDVHGMLYEVDESELAKLDKFEGAPNHYKREIKQVYNSFTNEKIDAIVYIAQPGWVAGKELVASEEYKNHILEGQDWVPSFYYNFLLNTIKTKSNE